MSFEALQERLGQLQETTQQLQGLIDRLAGLESDDDDVVGELSAEISLVMKEEAEEAELLHEEIVDLRSPEHEKARLGEALARIEAEVKTSRVAFRKAQLSARRALDAAQKQERQLLVASYAAAPLPATAPTAAQPQTQQQQQQQQPQHRRRHHRAEQQQAQSATVSASHDVTAALRQTHALIVSEVSRSQFAQQTLAESTVALGELGERYGDLGGMLSASRALVMGLVRANKSDTWYLETAFYMLIATGAWLLYRRLLYGPLWLLVWWPLRTLLGTGIQAGSAVGSLVGGAMDRRAASMDVVDGSGRRAVVGMTEGAVPTADVGEGSSSQSSPSQADDGAGDSMVEKVAKIISDSERQHDTARDEEDLPNPKKRMWEEEKEVERVKDEL